jgi:hypothetical protein
MGNDKSGVAPLLRRTGVARRPDQVNRQAFGRRLAQALPEDDAVFGTPCPVSSAG